MIYSTIFSIFLSQKKKKKKKKRTSFFLISQLILQKINYNMLLGITFMDNADW